MNLTHRYDNIITLPRRRSLRHSPMSNFDRAAQFAPFAALTGYDAVIAESARLTDVQIELDEGGKALLDEKLQIIREHLTEKPLVTLRVFCPDRYKSGGAYEIIQSHVKKVDPVARVLVLTEGDIVPIDRIYGIDCCQFPGEVL